MKVILVVFILSILSIGLSYSQVNVPLTNSDLTDMHRERDIIKMMNIDISQTWLHMVKDNLVSTNRVLISEISYNEEACPTKIVFFDESRQIETYTVVKYNTNNLPFEEIQFSSDSSLINGIMYMYDDNSLLSEQINYNNNAGVISRFEYHRSTDSIYISEYDNKESLVSTSLILVTKLGSNESINKIVKISADNQQIEEQFFQYDDMSLLRKKILMKDGNSAGYKEFIYNDEGALVKSSSYNNSDDLINCVSFEYDSYGNMIRIIENEEDTNSSQVFSIKYLSRIQE